MCAVALNSHTPVVCLVTYHLMATLEIVSLAQTVLLLLACWATVVAACFTLGMTVKTAEFMGAIGTQLQARNMLAVQQCLPEIVAHAICCRCFACVCCASAISHHDAPM